MLAFRASSDRIASYGTNSPSFSKIDEVSNAGREELFDLLPRLHWIFVSRVFASEKLKRDDPVGVLVGPRRSFLSWHIKVAKLVR